MKTIERITLPSGKTRIRVSTVFEKPSKTQQQFKDDCDVNLILEKYTKGEDITHLSNRQGTYADVSQVDGLLDAHIQLKAAEKAFMQLPAQLRKKLGNNPLALEDYLNDPENIEEALHYGLLQAREEYAPPSKPSDSAVGKNTKKNQSEKNSDDAKIKTNKNDQKNATSQKNSDE